MKERVLLLFSGGQDSTTVLAWCLKKYKKVHLICFDYGQNHKVEIMAAKKIIKVFKLNYPAWKARIEKLVVYKISNLGTLQKNALVSEMKININKKLPNTFVPGRNVLFYVLSASLAYSRNIDDIVSGVCETDYSGYPDCREETIVSIKRTLNLAMEKKFNLYTPLMKKNKTQTWKMAYSLGGKKLVELIKKHTHSCYRGDRLNYNEWGYGCGNCPACQLRKKGWLGYKSIKEKNVI